MKKFIGETYECTYCGDRGNTLDHVIPVSWRKDIDRKSNTVSDNTKKETCIPACNECNSLLNNFYLHTISKRAEYIAEKLSIRHKKILSSPTWSEDELSELERNLRNFVKI